MDDLKNINWLVASGGNITIGKIGPLSCAATASDEDQGLAMLARQSDESLSQLLARLDTAIYNAIANQVFADEINV